MALEDPLTPASLQLCPVSASIRSEYPDARAHLERVCAAHGWPIVALEERSTHRGASIVAHFHGYERDAVALMQSHLLLGVCVRLASLRKDVCNGR